MMTPLTPTGEDERAPLLFRDSPLSPASATDSEPIPLERTGSGTWYLERRWSGLRPLQSVGAADTTGVWVVAQRWYILALFFTLTANQCLVWFTFSSNPTEVSEPSNARCIPRIKAQMPTGIAN